MSVWNPQVSGLLFDCLLLKMSSVLERRLQELESSEKQILELGMAIMKAYGGTVYPFDLLAYAVVKRSLTLIAAFILLIRKKNFMTAAAILRLHLDSLLRFSAGAFVSNPHDFANAILRGDQIGNIKAADGKLMKDAYLVERLGTTNPWIRRVYRETSGYIHLSRKHISNSFSGTSGDVVHIALGKEDDAVSDEHRIEACLAMQAITNTVIGLLESWRDTKENPPPSPK